MKKEEVGRLTEQRALDTLTEKIESFEIEGNDKEQITLYLYPPPTRTTRDDKSPTNRP